jgi:type IV pilus secretin PilQ/predicted competence protein
MGSPAMNYKGLKFLTVLAFVIVVCVIAVAQNGNEDSMQKEVPTAQSINTTTQEQDENSTQKEIPTTLQQRMLKTISIDCINTPIEDVIRMLGEQADVDIIKSPTVTGNVTATLTNVPLAEALNNILAVNGYGCVIDRNMIRIAPIDELAQKGEILENRVYRITYADVGEVENALKKFISKRGSISSNPGTSNIIVTDTASSIKAIDTFIDEIDRITPQVMVEVRIYDITSTDGFDIGAEWAAGRNNPITSVTNTDTRAVVDTVDTVAPVNTGTVTTDTDTTTKTTGTAWQSSDAGVAKHTSEATKTYTYRKGKPFIGGDFSADAGGTIRLGLLDTVSVEMALNMLRKEVGAKLLANPRILVLDNETAEFKIISEIPYTEASQSSTGGATMTSIQFKEVGVELKVTPHVTRNGMVRLHIIPEFGVVSEKGVLVGAVQTVPTIDSRKVDTKALVKDGQTVVLGGLRKRTVTQTIKKVPILGDVPIMGSLFSDVSEEVKTNELIIFITPKIIIEPTLSPNEIKGLEATDFGDPKVTDTEAEKAERAEKAKKAGK